MKARDMNPVMALVRTFCGSFSFPAGDNAGTNRTWQILERELAGASLYATRIIVRL
jgi:hypothetical protein